MGRFLLATWPFVGCVYPFISVGKALRERGHEVCFYTGSSVGPLLRDEGFGLFPFHDVDEQRIWDVVVAAEACGTSMWRRPAVVRHIFQDWLTASMAGQVSDIEAIIEDFRPDVVVAETSMWGPILVLHEASSIPVALLTSFLGCMIPGPGIPPWGPGWALPRNEWSRMAMEAVQKLISIGGAASRKQANELRRERGLGPLATSINAYPGQLPLYLVPSVPELDYERTDLPPTVQYVGPCVWNRPSAASKPAWLGQLSEAQPIVHVTEGSLHFQDPFLLRAAAQGLADMDVQVILTTGPQRKVEDLDLGPLAGNMRLEQWVSHSDLLPHCSVVVTTGGAGTILASLQAGVPLIVVPTLWDKPDNAQRVVEAGAGIRIDPRQCTPQRLRTAVEAVLTEPAYRQHACELGRLMAASGGPDLAAKLLEDLIPPYQAEARQPAVTSPRVAVGG